MGLSAPCVSVKDGQHILAKAVFIHWELHLQELLSAPCGSDTQPDGAENVDTLDCSSVLMQAVHLQSNPTAHRQASPGVSLLPTTAGARLGVTALEPQGKAERDGHPSRVPFTDGDSAVCRRGEPGLRDPAQEQRGREGQCRGPNGLLLSTAQLSSMTLLPRANLWAFSLVYFHYLHPQLSDQQGQGSSLKLSGLISLGPSPATLGASQSSFWNERPSSGLLSTPHP